MKRLALVTALAVLLPATASAVHYVKSVEYVEIQFSAFGNLFSANLTKGQNLANCVPFAAALVTGSDAVYSRVLADLYFEAGPARLTARRTDAGGPMSVGAYVVEFDPAFVNVHQGTFGMAGAVTTTSQTIASVDLAKAALVSYYRAGPPSVTSWATFAVAGWFSAVNQITWQRDAASGAPIDGHYYVFEARSSEFSVEPLSFSIATNTPSATSGISTVDADKTFLVASYRTAYTGDDNEDGQIAVFLSSPTQVTARRQFQGPPANAISDIRVFVVRLTGDVHVQHGSVTYADADVQKTVTIQPVNRDATMVWGGVSIGPGAIESEATAAVEGDTGFQRLKLSNATTLLAERGEACGGADCGGVGQYEIVDFDPTGGMQVKSGVYTGSGVAGRVVPVGFDPDVVFVKGSAASQGVVRTSTMIGDLTKDLAAAGTPLAGGLVESLVPGGFTVGTDARVNGGGQTYYWVAFKAAALELKVGTYTGNNTDNTPVPVGFQPEYVITLPANAGPALHRSVTMTGDTSYDFDAQELGPPANAIQAFELGGFQVGSSASVNASTVIYHYIAWNFMPSRTFMGSYTGDGFDGRVLDVVGFMPAWLLVKEQGDLRPWVHKPASTGIGVDLSLLFANFPAVNDAVQALRPLGFEVGGDARVNLPASTYHWVAFGPQPPQTNYRSIGSAPDYGTGTVTVAVGSTTVSGLGTSWRTANRGRGDVITIPCGDPPVCTSGVDYTIASVTGDATLELTGPAVAAAAGASYLIRRQHDTLQEWEDCVDGPPGQPCPFFPVASDSLVADHRAEVGIAYKDAVYSGGLVVDGRLDNANTDARHSITLTADAGNRHHGKAGSGVVIDNGASATAAVRVADNFVTVEWMEVKGGGAGAPAIELTGLDAGSAANSVVLESNLLHDTSGHGVRIADPDAILDARNNVVYANAQRGLLVDAMPLGAGSRIRLRNNTLFGNTQGGIGAVDASNPTVTLENNLAHSNAGGDFGVPARDPASRNNLASDATAVPHSPAGGGVDSVSLAAIRFVSTVVGSEDLHIQRGSAAENAGADLGASFAADVDEETRQPSWEIGADDTGLGSGSCSLLTTSLGAGTITVETPEVRLVWDAGPNGGGGLSELYGKTEPNALVNRSGDVPAYNVFSTNVNDGSWFFEGNGQPGNLQALEATPLRVRLRQRFDYTGSIHLSRDWTAYAYPRLAIDETLSLDSAQGLRGVNGLHAKGEPACGGANTFFCAGSSSQADRVFVVSDDAATYSDMVAFPYGSAFFERPAAFPAFEVSPELGAPNTYLARVRENALVATPAGSDRRSYLLYPYVAGLASTGTGWRPLVDDYRSPDTLSIGVGAPWIDAAENTGGGDDFNEAENAYLAQFDPALGLSLDVDGATTRRTPFFKLRRWRSLQPPASVSLEGVPLTAGTDYRAAAKPLSRGHVCSPGCSQLAMGGLVGDASEFLSDPAPAKNAVLSLVGANILYLGSDSRFRGLNVLLEVPGAGTATLTWEYWNGAVWAPLASAGLTDGTNQLTRNGSIFWTGDPAGWAPTSVSGGPALHYVRAFLSGGGYTTLPKEALVRTDILLFQHCGDITANAQTFAFAPLASADLTISKADAGPTAVPGQPVTYTITVTNNGPTAVTGATVTDTLPASLSGASWTCTALPGSSCTPVGSGNIFDSVTLLVGGAVSYTLTATVDPFARGSLVNSATVSPPAGTADPDGSNDFASDTNTLTPLVDVQVVKSDDLDPVPLGAVLTYTLTVTNNGPSGATSVAVDDPLPTDMNLDTGAGAITASQGGCSYDGGTRTVSCALGDLGPAAVATVKIKVWPADVGNFTNTATTNRLETDSTPVNDSEGETTLVEVSTIAVRAFTVTSTSERNVLEWLNPTDPDYDSTEIRWSTVGFPASVADGSQLIDTSMGGSGGRGRTVHPRVGLNGQTVYYAAFVHRSPSLPAVSPGRFVSGRPFDTAGAVKWSLSTGATALAAPTVGGAGVIAPSNDHMLYAMQRGLDADLTPPDSGEWPTGFLPVDVGKPVQGRSPVVPIPVGGANPVVFLGSQDGNVYAIDAVQGGAAPNLWVESLRVAPVTAQAAVQAAPAGIFSDFAGTLDYILVGTYDPGASNIFFALDPQTGAELGRYDTGNIGIISAMAAVEYGPPNPRVYFTSHAGGTGDSLWCLDLNPSPPPAFSPVPRWQRPLGHIESSPIVRDGRVYVGTTLGAPPGTLYSIDALDGANMALDRSFPHGNGQVKGFVFPDRTSQDLYFSTTDFVWGVTDTGALVMPSKFTGPISLPNGARPSPVLFLVDLDLLYVGGSDGKLYEIDTTQASPVPKPVTLGDGSAVVGAPSYDRQHNLVHVGTEAGIFYAVLVPLP